MAETEGGLLAKDTLAQTGERRMELLAQAPQGSMSATGQAAAQMRGQEDVPEGKERGSEVEIVGGAPKPDQPSGAVLKPKGAQVQAAEFAVNGTVRHGTVGSPSGPVPVGLVADDRKHAEELLKERRDTSPRGVSAFDEMSEDQVNQLDAATLRTVIEQRSYRVPRQGTTGTRLAFLQAQTSDPRFAKATAAATEPEPVAVVG